ncbi:MAG TPA: S-methyl-5-thioribose-1-phosphate isomerase [Magnetospirillaceae bacterium]|nr:S-methyl-5-thioribose-1-phosphate isomerase [Magnetospirillaceae bacterium]
MKIDNIPYRTLWLAKDGVSVDIIDQTRLPHHLHVVTLQTVDDAARAIKDMWVRGAPLIGVTAAYGMALAARMDAGDEALRQAASLLMATRPTAVNLRWGVDHMLGLLLPLPEAERTAVAYAEAARLADEDSDLCESIGTHGAALFAELWGKRKAAGARRLNILTHCNAGWLATIDWGTALAPVYKAAEQGIPIHVWVDETRPRNQGAALTARELNWAGIPHTVIADNAGGHLMQHGEVDAVIVGTDRTTADGDVCNKIGTYLKALAAHDNNIPFYVGLPGPTIDWTVRDGVKEIPIEERSARELTHIAGRDEAGNMVTVQVTPDGSAGANPAFDVTPARLVTALITERGVCAASREGLAGLYPERAR